MEPVTHVLTGACLSRTGLNRRAAYATAVMAIGAELPDIDTVWSLRGPVSGFTHHRGITHTLIGIPVEAALLVGCACLLHQWRSYRSKSAKDETSKAGVSDNRAPLAWGTLYLLALLALLSHILLDFTNNYGVRPFFPFNSHWYAGSIVFIFDPLIFLLLVAGLSLPSLFALVGQEVGERRKPFRGAGWARAALCAICALWLFRSYEHSKALALAATETFRAPQTVATDTSDVPGGAPDGPPGDAKRPLLQPKRFWASPDPFSPFRWYVATDFGPVYELSTVQTMQGTLSVSQVLTKAEPSAALRAAEQSRLGRVYLDWSAMPWVTEAPHFAEGREDAGKTTVSFEDLRFLGSMPFLGERPSPPLTGTVVLDEQDHVLAQGMDGKFEH